MSDSKQTHTEIAIVDERTLRDKIYTIRGVKVMLDFELAELYGYETKNFNRQVKYNAEKFEGDAFMFRLTREEFNTILRCKNITSSCCGTRYLPYASWYPVMLVRYALCDEHIFFDCLSREQYNSCVGYGRWKEL